MFRPISWLIEKIKLRIFCSTEKNSQLKYPRWRVYRLWIRSKSDCGTQRTVASTVSRNLLPRRGKPTNWKADKPRSSYQTRGLRLFTDLLSVTSEHFSLRNSAKCRLEFSLHRRDIRNSVSLKEFSLSNRLPRNGSLSWKQELVYRPIKKDRVQSYKNLNILKRNYRFLISMIVPSQ
jgi:hypothetical protein